MAKKRKRLKLLDEVGELLKKKIEDADLKDLAFMGAWISGTYVAFQLAQPLKSILAPTGEIREMPVPEWYGKETIGVPAFEPLLGDPHLLLVSMVASYKFLTSDIGSIVGVLRLLGAGS